MQEQKGKKAEGKHALHRVNSQCHNGTLPSNYGKKAMMARK
jgi:hypothetical protein